MTTDDIDQQPTIPGGNSNGRSEKGVFSREADPFYLRPSRNARRRSCCEAAAGRVFGSVPENGVRRTDTPTLT
jgi:hypothetical protein